MKKRERKLKKYCRLGGEPLLLRVGRKIYEFISTDAEKGVGD